MTDPLWLVVDDQVIRLDSAIRCLRLAEHITPDQDPADIQELLAIITEHLTTTREHLHSAALEIKGEAHLTTV